MSTQLLIYSLGGNERVNKEAGVNDILNVSLLRAAFRELETTAMVPASVTGASLQGKIAGIALALP